MRFFQLVVFFTGILVLVLIDTMMILAHTGPVGIPIATRTDLIVFLSLFMFYFLSMAISMYPGYEKSLEETIDNDSWSNLDGHASQRSEET